MESPTDVITSDEFDEYESLRQQGITNMYDLRTVEDYTGLSRETLKFIMANYEALKVRWDDEN